MQKNHFIPRRDGDFDAFEENFSNKLTAHAATLGIDPNEVTSIKSHITNHRLAYTTMVSKRNESKAASEENNSRKQTLLRELRRITKQIKALKGYSSTIGDDLGIIGSDKQFTEVSELKPSLTAKMNGQEVVIKFKKEETDGIKLYSKRGNETEFTFLALDTQSPYKDGRPKLDASKPEIREYYAYFFEVDSEVGKQSDVIKITVQ